MLEGLHDYAHARLAARAESRNSSNASQLYSLHEENPILHMLCSIFPYFGVLLNTVEPVLKTAES